MKPAQWEATNESQREVAEEFVRQSRESSTLPDPEYDPSGYGEPVGPEWTMTTGRMI